MAERRRSAHAIDDQNNGGTLSAKKPRDPQSSYLYRSVGEASIHIDWVFHSRLALIYEYLLRALLVLFESADSVIMFGG